MNTIKNLGWRVAFAGLGINLALGILYAWSIFKSAIAESVAAGGPGAFQWNPASLNDPYAVATLVFALSMILAGIIQDKKGPALTALIGGVLVAAGFVLISFTTSYVVWILGFGVLAGTGIGFGYSASTPPALKWFPKAKSGLVAGLVVAGFGLASLYIAPLSTFLLARMPIQQVLLIFGLAFLVIVSGLSFFLKNPPADFHPENGAAAVGGPVPAVAVQENFTPREMIRTPAFYLLWLLFFIGAGTGLMVIGSVAGLAKKSLGDLAFLAVAIMAIGNAGGRLVAGILSDKIGRIATLFSLLLFQAVLMFVAIPLTRGHNAVLLVLLATFIGFNYGSNLAIFPSFAKSFYGMKNFGVNYGLIFTSWGVGGFIMSRLSQTLSAATGSYTTAFTIAGIMLIAAALLTLLLKKVQPHHHN